MKTSAVIAGIVAILVAAVPAAAQEGPIRIAARVAPASPAAAAWKNGVDLALREINARGGILGHQALAMTVSDADPATAVETVGARPYVFLDPGTFATSATAQAAKLGRYVAGRLGVRSAVLVTSGERPEISAVLGGIVSLTTIPSEPGQVDFSATAIRVRNAAPDALIVRLPAEEGARLLIELRRQGFAKPVVGDAALVSDRAVERAGTAVNGVRGLVGLEAEAPLPAVRDFARKYQAAYGTRPSSDALRGYATLYAVKAIAGSTGRVEAHAPANLRLSAHDEPGLLLDLAFDAHGAADRQALIVEIRERQPVIVGSIP